MWLKVVSGKSCLNVLVYLFFLGNNILNQSVDCSTGSITIFKYGRQSFQLGHSGFDSQWFQSFSWTYSLDMPLRKVLHIRWIAQQTQKFLKIVPVQKHLVFSSVISTTKKDRIYQGLCQDLFHLLANVRTSEVDSPTSAEHRCSVLRMVPHEMERLVGLEPLIDSRDLTIARPAVKVPRQKVINLKHLLLLKWLNHLLLFWITLVGIHSELRWMDGCIGPKIVPADGKSIWTYHLVLLIPLIYWTYLGSNGAGNVQDIKWREGVCETFKR